jgi:hypothetical protein
MRNAAGDGGAQAPHDQNAAYRAVVSDLVSLVEHVQKSRRLIEQTIAKETSAETSPETPSGSPESSTDIIVLDDVSPRYMKSAAALQACDVNLCIALRSLLDSGDSDPCAASCRRSRSSGRKADSPRHPARDQGPRRTHRDGRFRHRLFVLPAGLSIRQDQDRPELFRWDRNRAPDFLI